MKSIRRILFRLRRWFFLPVIAEQGRQNLMIQSMHDFLMRATLLQTLAMSKNPLNKFGAKYFSQSDEDGITLEIIRRLGLTGGTFAEIGVGTGLENNTLILMADGWRGFWIGGEPLAFDHTINPKRFSFAQAFVSLDNLLALMLSGMKAIGADTLDVMSLDVDGNDLHFAKAILNSELKPKLFIVEYNAKFPPPIRWGIDYNARHTWNQSDYFGASLALFDELFREHGYRLVCCNAATGCNAFFIRGDCLTNFSDIPTNIADIFIECRYQLHQRWGHPPAARTVEQMLRDHV